MYSEDPNNELVRDACAMIASHLRVSRAVWCDDCVTRERIRQEQQWMYVRRRPRQRAGAKLSASV
eukprot:569605-Pyramimonas_sp.AAC.1